MHQREGQRIVCRRLDPCREEHRVSVYGEVNSVKNITINICNISVRQHNLIIYL